MSPLVSIIIPVYNAEQFLVEAILSATNQTYKNIEIIVIDDGSSDQSYTIANGFNDPRLKIIKQSNMGGAAARNKALKEAVGLYVKFLDADDVLVLDAVEKQVESSKQLHENEIIFGDFNFINKMGHITQTNIFKDLSELKADPETFFLSNWKILISCPLHKKEYLDRVMGFDEKLPLGQESDLHFRLALDDIYFKYQAGAVFNYRSHSEDGRISKNRINKKKNGAIIAYSLDKKISLLQKKNGRLNQAQKRYFSSSFFGLARNSFFYGQKDEGHYYLSRSRQYAENRIPPFRKKKTWGRVYLLGGNIMGYSRLEQLIHIMRGNTSAASNELGVLFKQ